MDGSKLDPKFFGEGRVWSHFSARIRNLDYRIMFIRMEKVKVSPLLLKKKIFNIEKSKMYGFFEFCMAVLMVTQCSKNFLIVKFVFPDPINTLKVNNPKKIFFEKKRKIPMSKMYGQMLYPKFFGEGTVWGHFLARIRNLDYRFMFIRTKKSKYPLYF